MQLVAATTSQLALLQPHQATCCCWLSTPVVCAYQQQVIPARDLQPCDAVPRAQGPAQLPLVSPCSANLWSQCLGPSACACPCVPGWVSQQAVQHMCQFRCVPGGDTSLTAGIL
jgi:hypothetical protein